MASAINSHLAGCPYRDSNAPNLTHASLADWVNPNIVEPKASGYTLEGYKY